MTKFVNATLPSVHWNAVTILVSLDMGVFVDLHMRSILSLLHLVEPRQNGKVEQTVKFGIFAPQGRRNEPIDMKFST